MTPFQLEIRRLTIAKIRSLKKQGTVGMSVDNLHMVTPTPSPSLQGAPQGTNSQWVYRQMFVEVADDTPTIRAFVI